MTENNSKENNAVKMHKLRNVLDRLRNIQTSSESAMPKKSWLARLKARLGLGADPTNKHTP